VEESQLDCGLEMIDRNVHSTGDRVETRKIVEHYWMVGIQLTRAVRPLLRAHAFAQPLEIDRAEV
jgi:hypothetical protein